MVADLAVGRGFPSVVAVVEGGEFAQVGSMIAGPLAGH